MKDENLERIEKAALTIYPVDIVVMGINDAKIDNNWVERITWAEGALAEHEHLAPMMEENERLKRNLEFVKFDYTFMFQEVKRLRGIIANLEISCAEKQNVIDTQRKEIDDQHLKILGFLEENEQLKNMLIKSGNLMREVAPVLSYSAETSSAKTLYEQINEIDTLFPKKPSPREEPKAEGDEETAQEFIDKLDKLSKEEYDKLQKDLAELTDKYLKVKAEEPDKSQLQLIEEVWNSLIDNGNEETIKRFTIARRK